jgi:hypothetical protein
VWNSDGFLSHLRQPARDAQRDVVSIERCIPMNKWNIRSLFTNRHHHNNNISVVCISYKKAAGNIFLQKMQKITKFNLAIFDNLLSLYQIINNNSHEKECKTCSKRHKIKAF